MEVIKSGHSVYRLQYHVVWVCKYRRRILNPGVCAYIRKAMFKLLQNMPGVKIEKIGFDEDHIHAVMVIPPKYSIAETLARLKSQSSSMLRKRFVWLKEVYWKDNIVWLPGYFVSSVGIDEKTIKKYVEMQGRQDSGQLEEL